MCSAPRWKPGGSSAFHPVNKRLLKEVRESLSHGCDLPRLLQFLPCASDLACHSGDGSGINGSRVVGCGTGSNAADCNRTSSGLILSNQVRITLLPLSTNAYNIVASREQSGSSQSTLVGTSLWPIYSIQVGGYYDGKTNSAHAATQGTRRQDFRREDERGGYDARAVAISAMRC